MNALSQITAAADAPTVQRAANLIVQQLRDLRAAHSEIDDKRQALILTLAATHLGRIKFAADFIAKSDHVHRSNDTLSAFVGGEDERSVAICWEHDIDTNGGTIAYLRGVVIDDLGEEGPPLVIPASCCPAYFGAEMVRSWDQQENIRVMEAGL